ncbi:MAG: carbamoyl phosphate synthase small subunit [Bacteroidales bacterium]|nr:carbamoyl phosphate synthase small subunit [Bacteroidales bacterium]
MKRPEKKLVLEDGREFYGRGFGADCRRVGEVVFNTSVVGYQEIISDPTYAGRFVVMTYPLIGNYGITDEDYETRTPLLGGLIVRECCDTPSNFRYTKTMEEELEEHGIPGIEGLDTRALTRIIREKGRMSVALVEADLPREEALRLIAETPVEETFVPKVSCRKRWMARTPNHRFHVVAVDCGIKYSVIRRLNALGCNVTIVPYNTASKDILAFHPDGVLVSNGPGSPYEVPEVSALVAELKGQLPLFGIGLSHEVLALSYGAKLSDMGCGIHGDHPVRDLSGKRIAVAVLNQRYAVQSVEGLDLTPTFVTVPEGYVVGFENRKDQVLSVQFIPEAAPGPRDFVSIFDRFIAMMEEQNNA